MTSIDSIQLDSPDADRAQRFYSDAFGLGPDRIRVVAGGGGEPGFRGYTLSLTVPQPGDVQSFLDSAVAAGGTLVKPYAKSLWGVGGSVQAPDGALWTIASSSKKDTGPATREVTAIVLLLASDDVAATKKAYVAAGLTVGKSMGKYVEFAMDQGSSGFGLLSPKTLAKNAGVAAEPRAPRHLAISGGLSGFTDSDGVVWL